MEGWYVAKCNARKDHWVQQGLEQRGVEVYSPRVIVRKRGKDIDEPLFPTYLFCKFDPDDPDWPLIFRTPGLQYFLGESNPTRLPDGVIEYIRHRVEGWNNQGLSPQRLTKGNKIRVSNGPFAGLEGVFQSYVPSRRRCLILLHVVGRLTSVELSENDLAITMTQL